MPSLRSTLALILPLAVGIALVFQLPKIPLLIDLEHRAFWFPERTEPAKFFADHGDPVDFEVTPINFSPSGNQAGAVTLEIDAETKDILGADPLDPTHWAYLLNQARKKGTDTVAIATPLSWVEAGEIPIRTLDYELSEFTHAVMGISCEKTGDAPPLPDELRNSVISFDSWISDQLPEVDHLVQPPSAKAPLYGVSSIKGLKIADSPQEMEIPMLVRWGKAVLPSFELATLIARENLAPSDVRIEESGHLRLGAGGPIIRIDAKGFAQVTAYANTPAAAVSILTDPEPSAFPTLILVDPGAPPNHRQAAFISDDFSRQRPQPGEAYRRWNPWEEVAFLAIFTLALGTRRWWLVLPFLSVFYLSPIFTRNWFVISPILAVLLSHLFLRPARSKAKIKEEPEIFLKSEEESPLKTKPVNVRKVGPPSKETVGRKSSEGAAKKPGRKRKK